MAIDLQQYIVERVSGKTPCDIQVRLTYIGVPDGLRYVWQFIASNFLEEIDSRERRSFDSWDQAIQAIQVKDDLLVAVGGIEDIAKLRGADDIHALARIHQEVPTKISFQELSKTMSRREVKRGNALMGDAFRCEVSVDDDDFFHFYRTMHQPTMAQRYGEAARSVDEQEAYATLFKQGILFKVFHHDTWVAGSVSQIDRARRRLNARLLGIKNGDPKYRVTGAQNFIYHAILRWACESSDVEIVDLQGCEPFLTKGTLQYKKRFGAHAVIPDNIFGRLRMLLRPNLLNGAVRSFLINNPVLTHNDGGGIEATYFYDNNTPARKDIPFECPGISIAKQASLDALAPNSKYNTVRF